MHTVTFQMEIINTKSNTSRSPDASSYTDYTRRIYAFAHRRPHHNHIAISQNNEDSHNEYVIEDRMILSSLNRLIDEGEQKNSSKNNDQQTQNALVVYDGRVVEQKRKKKRKTKAVEDDHKNEEAGLGVVNVNGEEIDLKYLAWVADDAFEDELKKLTMGMVNEDDLLGVLHGLDGRWGSRRKRRKYVDAALLVKALPENWEVLLSLRPRARHPSLYCRQFVSPSEVQFRSCKDVAFYLRSQFMTNDDANLVNERTMMMQRENGYQLDLEADIITGHNELKSIPMNGEGSGLQEPSMGEDSLRVTGSGHGSPPTCSVTPSPVTWIRKADDSDEELEGLGVINVEDEEIDLDFLVHTADGTFMTILNKMTQGMSEEEEFLGFLDGLHGQWGSGRKRRKFVSASTFLKVLPIHWKVQLSLRPRVRQPSLYFRRFMSPAGMLFYSCKDVAYYLKSKYETKTDPPKEGAMLQTENYNQVDLFTVQRKVPVPHGPLLLREPNNPVHQKTVVNKDIVKRHTEHIYIPVVLGEGSSSLPRRTNKSQNNFDATRRLKMRCKWCRDFFHEPPGPETLASSFDFTCPNCKEKAYFKFKNDLSKLTPNADK